MPHTCSWIFPAAAAKHAPPGVYRGVPAKPLLHKKPVRLAPKPTNNDRSPVHAAKTMPIPARKCVASIQQSQVEWIERLRAGRGWGFEYFQQIRYMAKISSCPKKLKRR